MTTQNSGGIGFCGLLTLLFITLKLTGFIVWSWWLVLMPLWLPAAFILFILFALFCVAALSGQSVKFKKTRK